MRLVRRPRHPNEEGTLLRRPLEAEDALGSLDDDVVADYALTGEAVPRMLAAWKEAAAAKRPAEGVSPAAPTPAAFLAAEPDAMVRLLALISAVHGSTREYVRTLGVTDAVLAGLAAAMLEPQA